MCILGRRESKEWTSRGNVANSRHLCFHRQDRQEQNLATASSFECFAAKTRGGPDAESGRPQQTLDPLTWDGKEAVGLLVLMHLSEGQL